MHVCAYTKILRKTFFTQLGLREEILAKKLLRINVKKLRVNNFGSGLGKFPTLSSQFTI